MTRELWNSGWLYWQEKDAFSMVWSIPDQARFITLPHDAMLETPASADSPNGGNTGYRNGGTYVYAKMFRAPTGWKDQVVHLHFDGSYCNTSVYLNGQKIGEHPNGYTGFTVSLGDFLNYGGLNELRVIVRNSAPSARWYSGGGLYRDVYLLTAPLMHIGEEGTWVVTESLEEDLAVLRCETTLENAGHRVCRRVLDTVLLDASGSIAARERTAVVLGANARMTVPQRIALRGPKAWSAETPDLYTCRTRLWEGEKLLDETVSQIGIRTLTVDAVRGLRVNGRAVKLLGGCIHQDHGLLGAAEYEEVEFRRLKKMKAAGFNAIRVSHNPASPALLRACDQVGMYVFNEAFDTWTRAKTELDYSGHFDRWAEEDLRAMVLSSRNHPSVLLYGIGNEIPECATDAGAILGGKLAQMVRDLDATRPVTAAINGVFMSGDAIGEILRDVCAGDPAVEGSVNDFMTAMDTHMKEIVVHPAVTTRLEKACAFLDVAGYNYMAPRYEEDAKTYPNRVMVGSETYPPEFADNWEKVQALPQVIGDFTWTGWDYIGEAGVGIPAYRFGEGGFGAQFPCQLAYVGDFDITGFRRPASYYRQIAAGLRQQPYLAVQDPRHYGQRLLKTPWIISDSTHSWTWPGCEGQPVVLEVYTMAEEVELFCNETSLGILYPKQGIARKEILYQPGTLRAVARSNGDPIGEDVLRTAGAVRQLRAETESQGELHWIHVTLADDVGNPNDSEERTLMVCLTGEAQLMAFGSGDPKPGSWAPNTTKTFQGRAQVIVRGSGTVTVSSDRGEQVIVELPSCKREEEHP